MKNQILINWFRQDLRLSDNPSLSAAAAAGKVLSVYILDDLNSGTHKMGAASRWWLHNSLAALNKSLDSALAKNSVSTHALKINERKVAEAKNRYLTKPEIEKKIRQVRKAMEELNIDPKAPDFTEEKMIAKF